MADHEHAHSHGHSHGHSHASVGSWDQWRADPRLRVVLGAIVFCALLTVAGVAALWPGSGGQQDAIDNAESLGLGSQRLEGEVVGIVDARCSYSTSQNQQDCRTVTMLLTDGPNAGDQVDLPEINLTFDVGAPDLSLGDQVILGYEEATDFYFYADRDRRLSLTVLVALFAIVVVALGRFRGVLALLAMTLTVVVLVGFVAPSVLDGNDPLLVAVVASAAIAFISLYLTHGFSPTTTVALAGTLGALGLTLGLSWLFFQIMNFTGLATEEALILPFLSEELNVSSLLLGGAVIGALGALDDVTVTQVATVAELRFRSPNLPTSELVTSGIRVGREHIASTVNTLLLAYAGASLPLLLLFAASDQSLDIVANSELIAVEVVRTLCGSIGLVAAVPITTVLAALVTREANVELTDVVAGEPDPAAIPPQVAEAEPEVEPASWDDFGPEGDLDRLS